MMGVRILQSMRNTRSTETCIVMEGPYCTSTSMGWGSFVVDNVLEQIIGNDGAKYARVAGMSKSCRPW
jgi:hypothetical protein